VHPLGLKMKKIWAVIKDGHGAIFSENLKQAIIHVVLVFFCIAPFLLMLKEHL
jgi:hypothetical protein